MSKISVIPKRLQPGDTIGFFSPSRRDNDTHPAPLARAKSALEARGFRVKIFWTAGEDLGRGGKTTISRHIANRKRELLDAFADAEVKAIFCTIGGTTANELVPCLLNDPAVETVVAANPKIFLGYSDITVLHWTLSALTGLRTFYGPTVIPELGWPSAPHGLTLSHLLETICTAEPPGPIPRSPSYATRYPPYLMGNDPSSTAPVAFAPAPAWRWVRGGSSTGRLWGGCLPVVVRMSAVPRLAPDWRGRIVFLETALGDKPGMDDAYPLHRLRAGLADLVATGAFDEAAGLVIGRCFGYDDEDARAGLERTVEELFCPGEGPDGKPTGRAFPILLHVDIGHTSPMVTLPMGALASLDSEKDEFAILEAGVA